MSKIEDVGMYVRKGKTKLIAKTVQEALDTGCSPVNILQSMIDAMNVVGEKFSTGTFFVPEMLIAAKAMSKGLEVLKPHLGDNRATAPYGTCVIGTVQGDLHDIGKNLVAMMLESGGFKIIDLGVDVPAATFIRTIKDNGDVRLVACSGLLTTTMVAMRETVAAIKQSDLTGVKVMVGGAPVTQDFASEIGADGYAADAGGATIIARGLVG